MDQMKAKLKRKLKMKMKQNEKDITCQPHAQVESSCSLTGRRGLNL